MNSLRRSREILFNSLILQCRRVKCDETKPSCLRCVTTKRICEGYEAAPRNALTFDSMKDEERRAFLFFRSQTARRIFGHRDVDDWLPILLQIGHRETPVKHVITAVASLHESIELGSQNWKHAQISAQMLALRHYMSATKAVQIESPDMSRRPDIILILCILFICFEQFRSGDAACVVHLKAGFKLLYWWRHRTTTYSSLQEYSRPTLNFINNQITPILQRLRVQFSLCMDSRHALKDIGVPLCLPYPALPASYISLNHARQDFDQVMNYIFSSSERGVMTVDHNELPRRGPSAVLRLWKTALDASEFAESSTLQEYTIKLLNLYYHVSIIIAETCYSGSEMTFDHYTDHFQIAVELCESITTFNSWGKELQDFGLLFSFDLGITPPMFFVASRCRHPEIRRRAVKMMLESQSNSYRGAWRDRYSGLCAQRMMEIEEESFGIVIDEKDVLENKRIRKVSADLQETQAEILMQFRTWPFTTESPIHSTTIRLEG